MKMFKTDFFRRLLLTAAIAVLSFLLLGADYPEHDAEPDHCGKIVSGLCEEFSSAEQQTLKDAAKTNAFWLLQGLTR